MNQRALLLALVVAVFSFTSANAITIQTVPIGDVGNANDPATGNLYGGVNYAYNIGKYEVTVGQYTSFLNAVAATDTFGIYQTSMPGIARSGTSGSYSYSVTGSENNPVNNVTWASAARFANWLHNGQPTGAEDAGTTEDGAYAINGATGNGLKGVVRSANAKWFIPTESEWYKAAYYQPAEKGGDIDNYWAYPMRTNNVPYSDQPPGATPDNTRVGNFYKSDGLSNGYDDGYAAIGKTFNPSGTNLLTDVGAYDLSPSFYGTFDQGGNAYEWNEALISDTYRDFRGGSYDFDYHYLQASFRYYASPAAPSFGFRVASVVPEPRSAELGLVASLFIYSLQRRRKNGAL